MRRFGADNVPCTASGGAGLAQLKLEELQNFSKLVTEDVFDALTLEGSMAARSHIGGTAPARVKASIAKARKALA